MTKLSWKTFLNPMFLLIFSALVAGTYTDQFITKQVELVISARTGLSNMIFFWGGLSILCSIIFPLLTTLLCSYFLVSTKNPDGTNQNKNFFKFFENNFELNVIECLRAWGKTFLWGLLFILPAVRKYIHFILTPYVVYFSRKYKQGEVDALAYSHHFTKKMWWPLTLWLTLFMLVLPVIKYFLLDDYTLFSETPLKASAILLAQTFLEILFHYYILTKFIKLLSLEEPHEVPNAPAI